MAGVFLAEGAVAIVGETVSNLFFQADLHTTGPAARELWIALGSGLGVSLMAGLFPAWEATRVSPLESSRRAPWSPRSQGFFGHQSWGSVFSFSLFCSGSIPLGDGKRGALQSWGRGSAGLPARPLLSLAYTSPGLCPALEGLPGTLDLDRGEVGSGSAGAYTGSVRDYRGDANDQYGGDLHHCRFHSQRTGFFDLLDRSDGDCRSGGELGCPHGGPHERSAERGAGGKIRGDSRSAHR